MNVKQVPLKTIAWLSHERPEFLLRSVQSFQDSLEEKGSHYRFLIAESGKNQNSLPLTSDKNVTYINDEFRENLIEFLERQLSKENFSQGIARFCLDGGRPEGSEGAHRNAINLLSIDQNYLSFDDDVILNIKALPETMNKVSGHGERNFYSFLDWKDFEEFDGRVPSINLHHFLLENETALQKSAFCSPGLRGHSIFGGPRFIFAFSDNAIEEFSKDQDFFNKVLSSRLVWNAINTNASSSYSAVATYALGMNNSYALAPCFPFGRNLDGAFIYASKALNPEIRMTSISASVFHKPADDRGSYSSLETLDFRINDIIWLMWAEWLSISPSTLSTMDRYALSSNFFKEFAGRLPSEFSQNLKKLLSKNLFDRAMNLEMKHKRLKDNTVVKRTNYLELLEKEIHLCRKTALSSSFALTESRKNERTEEEALKVTQDWVGFYGKTLEAWPFMRSVMSSFSAFSKLR